LIPPTATRTASFDNARFFSLSLLHVISTSDHDFCLPLPNPACRSMGQT
jgi:hypothetical protein